MDMESCLCCSIITVCQTGVPRSWAGSSTHAWHHGIFWDFHWGWFARLWAETEHGDWLGYCRLGEKKTPTMPQALRIFFSWSVSHFHNSAPTWRSERWKLMKYGEKSTPNTLQLTARTGRAPFVLEPTPLPLERSSRPLPLSLQLIHHPLTTLPSNKRLFCFSLGYHESWRHDTHETLFLDL